jgi:DNA repair protein RadD
LKQATSLTRGIYRQLSTTAKTAELDELVVNSTGADFTTESLEKYWNQKRLSRIAAAVEFSNKKNQRTLVFCLACARHHAPKKWWRLWELPSAMVSGKTPMKEREAIIANYRAGKIKHMFNVGVFTTGFDVPELDCIVMARPTMSLALYYQMIGRVVYD